MEAAVAEADRECARRGRRASRHAHLRSCQASAKARTALTPPTPDPSLAPGEYKAGLEADRARRLGYGPKDGGVKKEKKGKKDKKRRGKDGKSKKSKKARGAAWAGGGGGACVAVLRIAQHVRAALVVPATNAPKHPARLAVWGAQKSKKEKRSSKKSSKKRHRSSSASGTSSGSSSDGSSSSESDIGGQGEPVRLSKYLAS